MLVTAAVLLGLTLGGRLTRRPGMARVVKTVHEQTALVGLLAIAVHGVTLLGDPWLHPGVAGLVVPFSMGYRPAFSGLGVLAGELAAILGLSYYARRRLSPRGWRLAHRLTPLVYVLALIHALGAGTDAGSAWLRIPLLASVIPVVALFCARLGAARRRDARPRPKRAPAHAVTRPAEP